MIAIGHDPQHLVTRDFVVENGQVEIIGDTVIDIISEDPKFEIVGEEPLFLIWIDDNNALRGYHLDHDASIDFEVSISSTFEPLDRY